MKIPKTIKKMSRLRKAVKGARTGRKLFIIANGTRKLVTRNPVTGKVKNRI